MSASGENERPGQALQTEDWSADVVLDEYWSQLSRGMESDPHTWLSSRGGDPALAAPLSVLSALHSAASERISPEPAPTAQSDVRAAPTSRSLPDTNGAKTPCLARGELLDGKLRVLALLGEGGMGEVYVAWHEALEREVAVKVLPRDLAADERAIARFRKSIALYAKPGGHPNIVDVMDAGQHHGQMYLVMEYVVGLDLESLARRRCAIPWREICDWMRQAALGLEHAHCANLVHRDIKPANMIRARDGTIKLLDWGLARSEQPRAGAIDGGTEEFTCLGTADYVSPEQSCNAATADARSDLYSLGCTMYRLLSGKPPFAHHKSLTEKLIAHSSEAPPPLRAARPDIPPAVDSLVRDLMEKEAQRRPATAGQVAERLEELLKHEAPHKRTRAWIPMAAIGLLLCAAALIGYNLWPGKLSSMEVPIEPPGWERLELSIAPGFEDPTAPLRTYSVIRDRQLEPAQAIPVFDAGGDAFRIEGRFTSVGRWGVVWIDSAGKCAIERNGNQDAGTEVSYPAPPNFSRVNPNDPAGVHLILVLAESDSSESGGAEGERRWDELARLAESAWPRPPTIASSIWVNISNELQSQRQLVRLRGPGDLVEGHTPRSYLREIESKLPKGLCCAAAIFLRVEP